MKTLHEDWLFIIWDHFNNKFKHLGKCYIAGGAARDSLMNRKPKDIDFFILGRDQKDVQQEISKILKNYTVVSTLEFHKSEPFLITTVLFDCVGTNVEVQILVNPASTIDALIDTFDWNTCLFAYHGEDGYVQKTNIEDIQVGKSIKLNKVTFPLSTLRRGFRFSERFGMKFELSDIKLLCTKILETKNEVGPRNALEPDLKSLENNLLPQ